MGTAGEEEDSLWCISTLFPGLFCFCPLCSHPAGSQLIVRDDRGVVECRDGVTMEDNIRPDRYWLQKSERKQPIILSRVQKTKCGTDSSNLYTILGLVLKLQLNIYITPTTQVCLSKTFSLRHTQKAVCRGNSSSPLVIVHIEKKHSSAGLMTYKGSVSVYSTRWAMNWSYCFFWICIQLPIHIGGINSPIYASYTQEHIHTNASKYKKNTIFTCFCCAVTSSKSTVSQCKTLLMFSPYTDDSTLPEL